jgi:hypothetical protein
VTSTVAALLLVGFAAIGALVRVPRFGRWPWVPLAVAMALAALLFVPTTCATGTPASPFNDVRGQNRPTACASVVGVELPELGRFASDTVGWGLALAGFCAALGAAVLVARRTLRGRPTTRPDSHSGGPDEDDGRPAVG